MYLWLCCVLSVKRVCSAVVGLKSCFISSLCIYGDVVLFIIDAARGHVGAKDRTPEIDISEIGVDFQWHFPADFPKGLSLVQWTVTGMSNLILRGNFQRMMICDV